MSFKYTLERYAKLVPALVQVSLAPFKHRFAGCSESPHSGPAPSPDVSDMQQEPDGGRTQAASNGAWRKASTSLRHIIGKSSDFARSALANDIQEVILAVWSLVHDFTSPLADSSKLSLFRAAQTWAEVQQATVAQPQTRGSEALLPEHCERWMRYTAAAFGAHKAGRLFDDPGAARRERLETTKAILSSANILTSNSMKTNQQAPVIQSSKESVAAIDVESNICLSSSHCENNQDFPLEDTEPTDDTNMPQSWRDKLAFMKMALNQQKQRLKILRSEEQQAVKAEQGREREALRAALARGKEALKAAQEHWRTPAGRGTSALICAGVPPAGIEVIHFVESKKPLPGEPHLLGQMVAVDHVMGCVVVALRGSSCFRDILADLNCRPEDLKLESCSGHAHSGMLRMAQHLDEPLMKIVQDGLQKLSGPPRVLLCGHSLGAGVAALLAVIWNDSSRRLIADIRCLAFACPQILDARLASVAYNHTTSFIVGDDWIPRLSLATAMDLRDALVCLQNPEAHGLSNSFGMAQARMAFRLYDVGLLIGIHDGIREKTALAPRRLYPSGRIIHLTPGTAPREIDHSAVEEVILTKDMIFAHAPRRYLGAIQAAGATSEHVANLWPLWSSL